MRKAYISEIFSSLQGEGIYQGVRQIFIRFAGCNLNCDYCDTPESRFEVQSSKLKVSSIGGSASGGESENQEIANPVSSEDLINLLSRPSSLVPRPCNYYHSVSLTGGEPLLQVDFLEELIPEIKKMGLKTYLETNGTLPEKFVRIADLVDYIAMDVKLPSATGKNFFPRHKSFLKLGKNKTFVKTILTQKTTDEEIWWTINLIKNVNSKISLIFQPVTPASSAGHPTEEVGIYPPEAEKILAWYTWAKKNLADVRIIPQKHKVWGLK